jgi:hypothetical protein
VVISGAARAVRHRERIEELEAVALGAAGSVDLDDPRISGVRPLTSTEIECLFVLDALTSNEAFLKDLALVELTGPGADLSWRDVAKFLIKFINPGHPLAHPDTPRPKTEAAWHEAVEGLLQAAFGDPGAAKGSITGLFDSLDIPRRQQKALELAAADSLEVMEKTTPTVQRADALVTSAIKQLRDLAGDSE